MRSAPSAREGHSLPFSRRARYPSAMTTIALYGSGEFLPWSTPIDDWCLERSAIPGDRVVILPTASAPEGDDAFSRWARMGIDHYEQRGLRPEVLDVRARADAEREDIAARIDGARLIFFSGGNPGFLAETLAGTRLWRAVHEAVSNGVALAGCSAGAVFLGVRAPDVRDGPSKIRWVDGVRLLSLAFIAPHFDLLDTYQPGLRDRMVGACPPGCMLVGIDEDTAFCGDGEEWTVLGKRSGWIGGVDALAEHPAGEPVRVPLGLRLP